MKINYTIESKIDQHHADRQERPRYHFGCSLMGHYCDRWLWLSFRWAVIPQFDGRILRLFRRGHNEEATVVADLRSVGIKITHDGQHQKRVSFGSHIAGSVDGIIESGVPESPKKRHILEIKTHSKKSFDDLVKNGVEKSKFQHYAQMQLYMMGTEIDRALYVSVCKDDDRLYTERVRFDKGIADKLLQRGIGIALANRMPPPISTDPSWYQCKICSAHEFCHKTNMTEEVNCRTCAHSTPTDESKWVCERYHADIADQYQFDGCDSHVLHPDLVPWEYDQDASSQYEVCYIIDGNKVINGESNFLSREIVANPSVCATEGKTLEAARSLFGARVSG